MNDHLILIDTDDYEVSIRDCGYSSRASRPTVYVTSPDPDMETPPFGSVRGDDTEADKAWKRYNRAEIKMKRETIAAVLPLLEAADPTPSIFDALGREKMRKSELALWDLAEQALTGKLGFSRKAGCSCGCSPGFKAQALQPLYRDINIWVEDKSVERDWEAAKKADEEAARGYDIDQLDDVDLLSYYA